MVALDAATPGTAGESRSSVVVVALGSRGDVEPLAILAGALAKRGHDVTIIAIDEHRDLVEDRGARVATFPGSLADAFPRSGPWRRFVQYSLVQSWLLRRWAKSMAVPLAGVCQHLVTGRDLVVTGILGRCSAAELVRAVGCRMATVVYTGQLPTVHRESFYAAHLFTGWRNYDRRGTRMNWFLASRVGAAIGTAMRRAFGTTRTSAGAVMRLADRYPVVVAVSPILVPPAPDWPSYAQATGFLADFSHPALNETPPAGLKELLAAGDPVVFLSLGSMGQVAGVTDVTKLAAAAARANVRLVVPAADVTGAPNDRVLPIQPVAYSWLFPQLTAVIHHGGAGTTHTGLASGVPSAAIPFGMDQPYHARRLYELGVGPAPIPFRKLTQDRLTALLEDISTGPRAGDYRERAAAIAAQLRQEDGINSTVAAIEAAASG